MRKSLYTFIPVLILFFSFCLANGQNLKLEFNPPAGTEYVSEFDIQSSIDQTIMGIDQNVEAKTFMVIHSRVIENTADFCKLEMMYKRLAVETSTAFFSMVIDSEGENEDERVNAILKALLDEPFTLKIGRTGNIMDIEGMESLVNKMMAEIQGEDKLGEQYSQLLNQSFGKENLVQNLGMASAYFPESEIEKGSSWSYDQKVSASEFEFQLNTNAVLQDFNEKEARVLVRSEMNTPKNNSLEIQGVSASMALKGSQVGEINIDILTGITLSSFLTQNIDGSVELNIKDNGMENMTILMKINSSIHIKTTIN